MCASGRNDDGVPSALLGGKQRGIRRWPGGAEVMGSYRLTNWPGFGLLRRVRAAIRAGLSPHGGLGVLATFDDAPQNLERPNLFILGAGKCGTTSLHHALSGHPQIHLARVKEPTFFSSGFQIVSNPIDYFNLFPKSEGKRLYGEASHAYLSAPEAAPVLRQLFPDARFLLIVRDPVQRAHSLYRHMRRYRHEHLSTFEKALAAEDARFANPKFRANCPQYFWNYMYVRSSRYDVQLRRYLDLFPRSQFFVLTLGEWAAEPRAPPPADLPLPRRRRERFHGCSSAKSGGDRAAACRRDADRPRGALPRSARAVRSAHRAELGALGFRSARSVPERPWMIDVSLFSHAVVAAVPLHESARSRSRIVVRGRNPTALRKLVHVRHRRRARRPAASAADRAAPSGRAPSSSAAM